MGKKDKVAEVLRQLLADAAVNDADVDRTAEQILQLLGVKKSKGPYHLVNHTIDRHLGPFTEELDCLMVKQIAPPNWANAAIMDHKAFRKWLDKK